MVRTDIHVPHAMSMFSHGCHYTGVCVTLFTICQRVSQFCCCFSELTFCWQRITKLSFSCEHSYWCSSVVWIWHYYYHVIIMYAEWQHFIHIWYIDRTYTFIINNIHTWCYYYCCTITIMLLWYGAQMVAVNEPL